MTKRAFVSLLLTAALAAQALAGEQARLGIPELTVTAAPLPLETALPAAPSLAVAPVPPTASGSEPFPQPSGIALAAEVVPVAQTPQAKTVAAELTRGRDALAGLQAPDSLSEVTLDPEPGRAYMPSPEDWRDEFIYSPLIDRFSRGPNGRADGDPRDGKTRHGGDLQGVIDRLDYIKGMGATVIMLSPVTMTTPEPGAYHGYGPVHFMAIDPHLGTLADYRRLVDEAHKRGLRVIFDLVLNHAGPVFQYSDGDWHWRGLDRPAKEIDWTQPLRPVELAKPERFTRHGVIENWRDEQQAQNGDFPPDYRHFASNDPKTQDDLLKIAKWWIKEFDIDGMRIDALRHINPDFARRFSTEIPRYAKSLGKDDFLLIGEHSTGVDAELAQALGTGVGSLYNYPEYRRNNRALHGAAPTRELEDSFGHAQAAFGPTLGRLVRFLDNLDVFRFLREGEDVKVLKAAFAFMLFSLGIPFMYYGTEQAFRQRTSRLDPEIPQDYHEPENRQDMFAEGRFKSESSAGDKFDQASESYLHLRTLAAIRKAHPALRRGAHYVRWSDPAGPGIYAFSRILGEDEVVVVMNTAAEPRGATMFIDAAASRPGTAFADELDPTFSVTAAHPEGNGGSQISVTVPPHGVRVLVRRRP